MIKILIHSQNTPLATSGAFSVMEQIVLFEQDFKDQEIDEYIHQSLLSREIAEKMLNVEIIFIKIGLSKNYLEYYGLRVAYHLRLSTTLKEKSLIPIVFVGEESPQFLGQTAELPEILLTKGIYFIKDKIAEFEKIFELFKTGKIKGLTSINSFLNRINIPAPPNYLSNHSIDNEWSMLNWAKSLNLTQNKEFTLLSESINSMLYYKFLSCKQNFDSADINIINAYKISKLKSKIMYVDDEWNKGWKILLQEILGGDKISKMKALEIDYKKLNYEQIKEKFLQHVKSNDPDIIILDLRLCDDDFKKSLVPEELSGIKLLKITKEINPGIQVAIFSATNKIWNLIELQNEGADAFVFKSPSQGISYREIILNFKETIENLQENIFKKILINKCFEVRENLDKQFGEGFDDSYDDFIIELKKKLQLNVSNLAFINLKNKVTLDISFLSFFNLLETFKKYYFAANSIKVGGLELPYKTYHFDRGTISIKKDTFDQNWSSCMSFLFIDYFNITKKINDPKVQLIFNLNKKRNDFIHNKIINFSKENIIEIVDLLSLYCKHIKA